MAYDRGVQTRGQVCIGRGGDAFQKRSPYGERKVGRVWACYYVCDDRLSGRRVNSARPDSLLAGYRRRSEAGLQGEWIHNHDRQKGRK